MRVDIRHSPSSAVARCFLDPNEAIKVQPGAMMAQTFGVEITAKADGGILGGLGRMVAGENFLVSTFTAPQGGGWVDVVSPMLGDIFAVDVDPQVGFTMVRGAWLANDGNINVSPDAQMGSMFSGSGLVVLKATGQGTLVGSTYGSIDVHTLKPGEGFTIDTGHIVAWENTMQIRTRRAGGWMNSLKSGEGFVADVMGPGDIITQSRIPIIPVAT